jgi:glutamate-1-semialdehyde 2,1-aminomutase
VAGGTSTGSKRPEVLFGPSPPLDHSGLPLYVVRTQGARVWDADGREYLDLTMALGAVALGYGHPAVSRAVRDAVDRGTVGPLPPVEEERVAELLAARMPWLEQVRFLKTGAEAVAAAVRLARVATGRERVLGCGYHGWLDWCRADPGVPAAIQALYGTLPFNDIERSVRQIRAAGDALACVVIEPVVDEAPSAEWLAALRGETRRVGALLVFDEIKTGLRVAPGGAVQRWGGEPDLVVLGKALASGYPLAVIGGRGDLLGRVADTWISSTLATEAVALAAAEATLQAAEQIQLCAHLGQVGSALWAGLRRLADRYSEHIIARGIPEMCYLQFADDDLSARVARGCARRGLLFKRAGYNFVSLAHDEAAIAHALALLEQALEESLQEGAGRAD